MAIDALAWCPLVHSTFVARVAVEGAVNAAQRETTHGVFEIGIFPKLLAMALTTVRERSVVDIIFLVTHFAIVTHSR